MKKVRMTERFFVCVCVCVEGCKDGWRIMKRQRDSPSLERREGRTEREREHASQKIDGERNREVKEIKRGE